MKFYVCTFLETWRMEAGYAKWFRYLQEVFHERMEKFVEQGVKDVELDAVG